MSTKNTVSLRHNLAFRNNCAILIRRPNPGNELVMRISATE